MYAITPEALFHIGSVPITNTLVNTIFVDTALIGTAVYIKNHIKEIPSFFQNIIEISIESMYNFVESVAGANTTKIFPFVMSFFLFILVANWSGLIPGIGAIGIFKHAEEGKKLIPLTKSATSDLNVTFALALISLAATHVLSVRKLGIKEYLSRYISFNPINLFVGVLEIISEFTKIVSLSFRLFGNIYAGEVVLTTISTIFAFVFPIPFLFLEIIVGFVQALVFSLLTMVFMSVLMTSHHQETHEEVKSR